MASLKYQLADNLPNNQEGHQAMDAHEVMKRVNGHSGFGSDLQLPTVAEMLRRGQIEKIQKGQYVTRRGQGAPRLCIVLDGAVRLTAFTEDGREMLTHIIRPGDCWGVHPCLGGYQETNDAIADTQTTILVMRSQMVGDLMWTHRDFQNSMVSLLCRRLNLTVSLAEQLGSWNARERVVWRLLLLADALDPKVTHSNLEDITTSQETLAAMVHLSRQSTNVVLRNLAKDGLLELKYGRIGILSLDGLRQQLERTR